METIDKREKFNRILGRADQARTLHQAFRSASEKVKASGPITINEIMTIISQQLDIAFQDALKELPQDAN